jgi:hypothetical protein
MAFFGKCLPCYFAQSLRPKHVQGSFENQSPEQQRMETTRPVEIELIKSTTVPREVDLICKAIKGDTNSLRILPKGTIVSKSLRLVSVRIDDGWVVLSETLSDSDFTSLEFGGNRLADKDIENICRKLKKRDLVRFSIWGNSMSLRGFLAVVSTLRFNVGLENLVLSNNLLNDACVIIMQDQLIPECPNLKLLDLSLNIDITCVPDLLKFTRSRIEVLRLSDCSIRRVLRGPMDGSPRSVLGTLDLRNNPLPDAEASELCDFIKSSRCVSNLDITGCHISPTAVDRIRSILPEIPLPGEFPCLVRMSTQT